MSRQSDMQEAFNVNEKKDSLSVCQTPLAEAGLYHWEVLLSLSLSRFKLRSMLRLINMQCLMVWRSGVRTSIFFFLRQPCWHLSPGIDASMMVHSCVCETWQSFDSPSHIHNQVGQDLMSDEALTLLQLLPSSQEGEGTFSFSPSWIDHVAFVTASRIYVSSWVSGSFSLGTLKREVATQRLGYHFDGSKKWPRLTCNRHTHTHEKKNVIPFKLMCSYEKSLMFSFFKIDFKEFKITQKLYEVVNLMFNTRGLTITYTYCFEWSRD